MSYHYVYGALRWKRYTGTGDVRGYRPAKGWDATAHQLDHHPITDRPLKKSQWWICEKFRGI